MIYADNIVIMGAYKATRKRNMTDRTIIETNSKGQRMTAGSWWSITKPLTPPSNSHRHIHDTPAGHQAQNVVYHVGQEKYIRRIWNKEFKN